MSGNKIQFRPLIILMKKAILFILILFSGVVKAQVNGNFTVNWIEKTKVYQDSSSVVAPQFQGVNFRFDDVNKSVSLVLVLPVSVSVEEKSLQILNTVYETVSVSQLGDLSLKAVPSALNAVAQNSNARDKLYVSVSLSPIIKDGSGFKRLKSFSYSLGRKTSADLPGNREFNAVSNSVLQNGDWYRFYVEKSGVYKISKSFLQQLGLKLNNVDPHRIKIYGNGGKMLPLSNNVAYPIDLTENAVYFEGEDDGVFNNEDYILFYAEGVDNWSQENRSHNNLYDSKSYYYVTIQGEAGKRITAMPNPSGPGTTITTFDDYQYHELDLVNFARLGRKWFGEDLSLGEEQTFDFNFPNAVPNSNMSVLVTGASSGNTNATAITVKENNSNAGAVTLPAAGDSPGVYGTMSAVSFPASELVTIGVKYDNQGVPGSKGYLDYIIVKGKRNLQGYGKQFRFQYNDAVALSGVGNFQVTNAASISQVWDITDIYNVTAVKNDNQASFSFNAGLGQIRQYIAVDKLDYFTPKKDSRPKVANQNLKGTIFKNSQGQFQDIDYLIITPAIFHGTAEKLANFHRTREGYNVKVVDLETIYPEFSSGKQDIGAIRNFVKYVYNQASSSDKRVKYLNLFGDASFDFKNRIQNNTNFVPIYHALESFSLSSSYISDDFFVQMDNNEGDLDTSVTNGLDIAVGRMPVDDVKQAEEMVNKVVEYHDIKSFGRWRNNFVLISDDVDQSGEETLEVKLDALGDEIFANKPFVNIKKIHSDSYIEESAAGGKRYPKVREDFVNALNQGALVFDYFGHGGEDGLAHERILEKSDVQNLTNQYKYCLFVTMTCEFTRFDNPYRPTAGEYLYWNPKGGAVSLVTTTRQITITAGQDINAAFAKNLFGYGTNDLGSIAEALRVSKVQDGNPLTVFYIGDPALKLALPKPKIVLTKVNDAPVTGVVDDFKALSVIKLSGEVRDEAGVNLLADYNGDLAVNIFDKPIQRTTLGNDGVTVGNQVFKMNFTVLGETIFRGNASVKNGLFEFSFVVPRDIRVPLGSGRISFYAKKTGQLIDQTGYDTSIKVGGINQNATADNIPPRAKLYMNDESFVSGGITNESPILLAFLEDENGINTASGIGHDIIAILDGDESKPYILNDYYETVADDYTKGKVKFPFRNLAVGLHTITLKAWDVYNNPISVEIQFIVVGDETLTLKNVLNYPNPFVNYTQFWFTHNRPFEPLEVQVQVMTITGKVVWTKNQIITTEGFLSREITWDGKDDFGDKIGKGVYVYKLTVKSTLTNKKTEKFEKLVIL